MDCTKQISLFVTIWTFLICRADTFDIHTQTPALRRKVVNAVDRKVAIPSSATKPVRRIIVKFKSTPNRRQVIRLPNKYITKDIVWLILSEPHNSN
jgi:hypothetical protein